MTALWGSGLQDDFVRAIFIVACSVLVISLVGLLASICVKRRPALRHMCLLTALLFVLASPGFVAVNVASDAWLVRLPWLDPEEPVAVASPGDLVPSRPTTPADSATAPIPNVARPQPNGPLGSTARVDPDGAAGRSVELADGTPPEPVPARIAPLVQDRVELIKDSTDAEPALRAASSVPQAFWIWFAGSTLVLIRFATSWRRLRTIRHSLLPVCEIQDALLATKQNLGADTVPDVACSDLVRVPMVLGWRHPTIVLPIGADRLLSAEELADVLTHETAHVIRRDQLVLWLQWLARCLLWPILPIHVLNRELSRAREEVCDNFVLKKRDAVCYGRTLLKIAEMSQGAAPVAGAMAILQRRGELEQRIAGLLRGSRVLSVRPRRAAVLTIIVSFTIVSAITAGTTLVSEAHIPEASPVPATSQESVADPRLSGTTVTADGTPGGRARLWLVSNRDGSNQVLAQTESDGNGAFAFNKVSTETFTAHRRHLSVWATTESAVGWTTDLYRLSPAPLTIRLRRADALRGRIRDADGNPVSGATVKVERFVGSRVGSTRDSSGPLPDALNNSRTVTTNTEGAFAIPAVPTTGSVRCLVRAEGFGEWRLWVNAGRTVTVVLDRPASVSGSVTWPDGVTPPDTKTSLGHVSLNRYTFHNESGAVAPKPTESAYMLQVQAKTDIRASGQFQFERVPAGQYQLYFRLASHVPARPGGQQIIHAKSGEPLENVQLTTLPAVRIEGRVIGFEDSKPVADALVQFMTLTEGSLRYGEQVRTDSDGRYVAHGLKGTYLLKVLEAPSEYVPLESDTGFDGAASVRIPKREVTENTVWPDLALDPATDVTLEVVNEQGEPVAGAVVDIVTMAGYPAQKQYGVSQVTDRNGRYIIRRVATNDTLPIRVHTPTGISKPGLVITPGELNGPLRVKLSDKHGYRFRCRVQDRHGNPVPNAKILVETSFPYVTKWIETGLYRSGSQGGAVTDARGVAITGPMWPDLTYSVSATADGFDRAEAPQTRGSGDIHDLKPFVLVESRGIQRTGTVTDTAGQPLKGVRMYASGAGGRNLTTTTTNAEGKFRFEETAPDVRYVFADAPGFRFGGARVTTRGPIRVTLRPNDSPALGVRPARVLEPEEQHAAARELINLAWTLPTHPRSTARIGPLEAMVRIDPEAAREMASAAGGHFNYVVRAELATRLARTNPDRALALLQRTRNWRGISTTLELGRRLARSTDPAHRKTAERLARLAEVDADTRAPAYYPGLARLHTLLGEDDKARRLIRLTLEAIDGNKPDDKQIGIGIQAAIALAPYDYERAKELAGRAKAGYSRTRALADIAVALADRHPEQAIQGVETLTGDGNAPSIRDTARLRVALKLVHTQPDLAIGLVNRCEESGNRAQAQGRLAVEVAKKDKRRAWELIDAALAIHRSERDSYGAYINYGSGGPFAAALAYHAMHSDYPDMESVVWHVRFACRAKGDVKRGQRRLESTIGTARILALVDKVAARELLNAIADKTDHIPRGQGGVSLYDQWLHTWLLVDFQRGTSLLKDDLEELAASGKDDPLRYGHGSVFRLLAADPDERFRLVTADATALWDLGEEDN